MVDDVVGQVREALRRNGIDSNTIVVFTTDNGCSPAGGIPEMAAKGHHANYIWRGMKADLFDGGHRVPTIVEWPTVQVEAPVRKPSCLNDFYASLPPSPLSPER